MNNKVHIHGHRGCRGYLPENTLAGFLRAAEMGVYAIELDVVVSKEKTLIVSHDPYMRSVICSHPYGGSILYHEELSLNLYKMTEDEIRRYPCGVEKHPDFPHQRLLLSHKQPLREIVYALRASHPEMAFTIEVKSKPEWDGQWHPHIDEYASIVIKTLHDLELRDDCVVQSFDARLLQAMMERDTSFNYVFLTEKIDDTFSDHVARFPVPLFGIGPHHALIDEGLMQLAHQKNWQVLAWTVNEKAEAIRLKELGVQHLITDYPDVMMDLF